MSDFLKHEMYIEKDDPQIQKIAKSLKARTETDLVKKIYYYVINNMKYTSYKEELGAAKAVRKKRGDCIEYSDLFTALCRAKNIPARVVKGYAREFDRSPEHAWAEVYLKKYGWVPFDPIYGDAKSKSARKKRFHILKPIYIYLTNIRNDRILDEAITVRGLWIGDIELQDSIVFK